MYLTLATLRQLGLREEDVAALLRRIDERLMGAQYRWELEVPIEIRGLAVPPTDPSQPKWTLMIIGGVIFGLLAGLGVAVLLEIVDTSIKKPSDIRRRMDLPLLGMVPHIDDLEEEISDPRLAMQTFPDSPVGEAFRQIRTRVVFSGPIDRQRTLMVTSPLPEDGRTTVAVNLAGAMAQGGSKVIIIDANFRQPMLHHLFEGAPGDGLSNVLIGQTTWQQLVHEADENLHVLSAGPLPPNPAELLASRQMRTLLSELTDHYDRVLFDTGPCLVVTDPCVLASEIDGVIMVYRAGANSHGVAQRARDAMLEANARILGAVLNGVRAMAGGYLRKNYEAFYDYRERQPLPAP
jgi:capsular exopolysaccharide synthesis family protein